MFKVNNKDTKTTSLTYFTPFSTADSKQVNFRDNFWLYQNNDFWRFNNNSLYSSSNTANINNRQMNKKYID